MFNDLRELTKVKDLGKTKLLPMNKRSVLLLLVVLLLTPISLTAPPPASGMTADKVESSQDWQTKWRNIVSQARNEGKVSLYADIPPQSRAGLIESFKKRYDITLEILTIKGSLVQQKLVSERRSGIFYADMIMSGGGTAIGVLKPMGFFENINNYLILPEVTAKELWEGGKIPYLDIDRQTIAPNMSVSSYVAVNSTLVKPGEITSYQDMLAPKWKGKILLDDPSSTGSGSGWFSMVLNLLGKDKGTDFMQRLVKQAPVLSRDPRLETEWLARGKYHIGIGVQPDQGSTFKALGAPLEWISPAEGSALSPGSAVIALLKNAPHPNAQAVFLNWLLSREGRILYSNATLNPSLRTDVPELTRVDPARIPRKGQKYYLNDEEFYVGKKKMIKLAAEIFAPLK